MKLINIKDIQGVIFDYLIIKNKLDLMKSIIKLCNKQLSSKISLKIIMEKVHLEILLML